MGSAAGALSDTRRADAEAKSIAKVKADKLKFDNNSAASRKQAERRAAEAADKSDV